MVHNIAPAVIEIIDAYGKVKLEAFEAFIATCKEIAELTEKDTPKAAAFIESQLQPNVDARVFEIVSYAVLKAKYGTETIWIGDTREDVAEEALILYKTGRTNANDGGIDFVMKPKGRFFQVTETIDMGKYFLDIDKVQRYPITFVVKSAQSTEEVFKAIRDQATTRYRITSVIEKYMAAIEEVITTPQLLEIFRNIVAAGGLPAVMAEVIIQGKVEFHYKEADSDEPSVYEAS